MIPMTSGTIFMAERYVVWSFIASTRATCITTTASSGGDGEGARGRSRPAVAHPGMGLPNVISVEPGRTGTITFQFAKPTTLLMQCHEPGHLEGGMTATITITA